MSTPQPPNFGELAKQFANVSEHFRRVSEAPDVQKGDQILASLDNITSHLMDVDAHLMDIDNGMDKVVKHLECIQVTTEKHCAKEAATAFNEAARNFHLAHTRNMYQSITLMPLRNWLTNEDIPGFPATCGELALLQEASASQILAALGGGAPGGPFIPLSQGEVDTVYGNRAKVLKKLSAFVGVSGELRHIM